jgi:TolB-like protein/Tfp pilus assembly protein PilF
MTDRKVTRRLAAILAADIVGYSAMMGEDETGTLAALKTVWDDVFNPKVAEHDGRIVKMMGDGALVEFPSVVDAVTAATAIQQAMAKTTAEGGSPIEMRIGINLGDIIIEGGDIFGDGVNIAARLEGLADPGGICVSAKVHDEVAAKLTVAFDDMGRIEAKNIAGGIRAYRLVLDQADGAGPMAATTIEHGDKPSIAVLPLDNMSGDAEQEYFSDGIAEDITAALSRFQELFVIARNSSFSYKGQAMPVKQIAEELGVKYILEGSVRRAGDRVRVTVQLIDAEADRHIWAEQYDRQLDDIFAVQDDITQQVVAAVAPETLDAEMARATIKRNVDLNGWERVMKARWHMAKMTRRDNEAALHLLDEAITAAPQLAMAHSFSAICYVNDLLHGWNFDPASAIEQAGEAAQQAVALDDNDANAFAILGIAAMFARHYDDALEHLATAIRLNPNLANAYGILASVHGVMGEYEQSAKAFETAFRLSPRDRGKLFWLAGKGIGAYLAKRYEDVVDNARAMLRDNPNFGTAHRQLAAALAMLGREAEAAEAMKQVRELMPDLTVSQVRRMIPVKDPDAHERWLEGLRRAGLPE